MLAGPLTLSWECCWSALQLCCSFVCFALDVNCQMFSREIKSDSIPVYFPHAYGVVNWVSAPHGQFSILKTRSFSQPYLICSLRSPLTLGSGKILIPELIWSHTTLDVYDVAPHLCPAMNVSMDFPFSEDEIRRFSQIFPVFLESRYDKAMKLFHQHSGSIHQSLSMHIHPFL